VRAAGPDLKKTEVTTPHTRKEEGDIEERTGEKEEKQNM
jgi:hypothetical protein